MEGGLSKLKEMEAGVVQEQDIHHGEDPGHVKIFNKSLLVIYFVFCNTHTQDVPV